MSKRKYRSRRKHSSSDHEEDTEVQEESLRPHPFELNTSEKLAEAREIQSIRKKPSGVSAAGLAYGKKLNDLEEKLAPDPFKLKTGGLVNLKEISTEDLQSADDEVVKRLTSQFSAETQTRDDETHMLKYIDDKMAELKGKDEDMKKLTDYEAKVMSLYQLPDRLKTKDKTQSEDMLSNQMLSGIPEVDLGLDAKFKNIEQTEEAKQKILVDHMGRKTKAPSNVPAANYIHQNLRFYSAKGNNRRGSEEGAAAKATPTEPKLVYIPVVGSHDEPELKASVTGETTKRKPDHTQMASDDYHFDKFKKKVRRF